MYQIENSSQLLKARRWLPTVSRTVVMLGLTSLFTDISSEMVATILPLYLLFDLHLAPAAFGVIDGLYQGAAALVRIFGGFAADRSRRYKEVAVAGYGLSAVARLGLLVVGNVWTLLAGVVMVDRLGKGIRTAPRDALISFNSPPEELGTAFGVHRALDTAGAMIGPVIGFGVLALAPGAYDAVFVISLCAAVIGLGFLTLFVQNPPAASVATGEPQSLSFKTAGRLLQLPGVTRLLIVGTALSLATISDGFLYVTLQRRVQFAPQFFPLLYVATAAIFMLLAVPMGRLADRVGRGRVFIGGYAMLLAVYVSLLVPWTAAVPAILDLALLGAYYAATDGVLMALAGAVLPTEQRASGMALLTTGTSLARLTGSILFGLLWTWRGVEFAIALSTAVLTITILGGGLALRRSREESDGRTATS
ncbi:MAG TPA: MFS transporter [Gemmatimonadales bacterium]|nr:MFS transporter [Gemmatimonadales bacterium]